MIVTIPEPVHGAPSKPNNEAETEPTLLFFSPIHQPQEFPLQLRVDQGG